MSVLSVRIDKELEEKIKFLMEKQKIIDKSAYIRKLLDESIKEELLDFLSKEIEKKTSKHMESSRTRKDVVKRNHERTSKKRCKDIR